MTFFDRILVIVAVLAGVVLAQGRLHGSPTAPVKCIDDCQEVYRYYDCTKKHAYEFAYSDCFPCVNGRCKEQSTIPGGFCKQSELPRKFRYIKGFTKSCDCDANNFITRIEIEGGENFTEWDQFDTDYVWYCKQPGTE